MFENYRPINIHYQVIDKIFECSTVRYLKKYLAENNLINSNQYGFQHGRSTEEFLSKLTDININLDTNKYVFTIFIDFSEEFDTFSITWYTGVDRIYSRSL